VRRLNQLFNVRLGTRAVVDIQNAAWINEHSFFCPDVLLLPQGFLEDEYPTPQDIHLVIEVADSSLRDYRRLKMPSYARVGVPKAWLIAIKEGTKEGTVYVYRQPSAEGYREVREYRRGDEISPEAFPDVRIPMDSILG
jgi:Uma2 family endonuclease